MSVTFGCDPSDGQYLLVADVQVTLPDVDASTAEELVKETEKVCPYAKMARQGLEGAVRLI